MTYHISRAAEREWVDVKDVPGLRQALMVGEIHGSHHMEISLYELAPGATLGWNRCPFEESWFVTATAARRSRAWSTTSAPATTAWRPSGWHIRCRPATRG
nr:hypothetical protein [Streptomyces sp. RPA4-2]QIY66178.1 hypothetical protein HEP85_37265 [Streptomyces sp. RPA4-2]